MKLENISHDISSYNKDICKYLKSIHLCHRVNKTKKSMSMIKREVRDIKYYKMKTCKENIHIK